MNDDHTVWDQPGSEPDPQPMHRPAVGRRAVLTRGAGWAAGATSIALLAGCADRRETGGAASGASLVPGASDVPTPGAGASAVARGAPAVAAPKSGFVPVPGARIYYQLRGAGPLVLVFQGGAADADATPGFVDQLARHYTVLAYDRRGYSRSTLDGAPQKLQITTHGDDAHLLLAALGVTGAAPARMFGSSIGALIALDVATRYPEQVRRLIAHEPPLGQLAPPDANDRALAGAGAAGAGGADAQAALQQFAAGLGIDPNDHEPGVIPASPSPYAAQNAKYFVDYDVQAAAGFRADLNALKALGPRLVPAAGSGSRDSQPYRAAAALAERMGTQLVEFPGSHAGYVQRPRAFTALLRDAFDD